MKSIFLILMLLAGYNAFSQSTITYYDENGMVSGKAKIERDYNPQPSFRGSRPMRSVPLDLVMEVGRMKQETFDRRLEQIQEKINDLQKSIQRYFGDDPEQLKFYYNELTEFVKDLNKKAGDLSNNAIYRAHIQEVNEFDEYLFSSYQEYIKEEK